MAMSTEAPSMASRCHPGTRLANSHQPTKSTAPIIGPRNITKNWTICCRKYVRAIQVAGQSTATMASAGQIRSLGGAFGRGGATCEGAAAGGTGSFGSGAGGDMLLMQLVYSLAFQCKR
jgi:uncharacterized protein YcfJ